MAEPQPTPQGPGGPPDQGGDPRSLHDTAVDIQTDLQKLATGLAHAGAQPQAVAQLTHMAQVIAEVVKVLAEGPPLDGDTAAQGAPPGAAPQAPPPAQPQAAPVAAQPALPPDGAPNQGAHHALNAATHALHAAMIASASKSRPAPQ